MNARLALALLAGVLCVAAAPTVRAQPAHPAEADAGQVADVPSGDGTIAGQVVHPGGGAGLAGLPVLLYALPPDGEPGLRHARTDAQGRFRFEGVAADPDTAYMVGTRYREVPFASRATFEKGKREVDVVVAVSDPSPDGSPIEVGDAELAFDWVGAHLSVVRTQRLENPTQRVIHVPEDQRARHAPLLRLELPKGADDVQPAFGLDGLERRGDQLLFWGPMYPGSFDLRVQYLLPAPSSGGRLVERLPEGASTLHVLMGEGTIEVEGRGLHPGKDVERDGRTYRVLEHGPVKPGGRVELAVRVPQARVDPDALSLSEVRMWLELDDTALVVSEEHHFKVTGTTPVVGTREKPLLRIPLPEDAELRGLSDEAGPLGLVPGPDHDLVLLGPVPPGESSVGIGYRLRAPAPHAMLDLHRRFGSKVPLLRVLVADTGVRLESSRLHRRRPIRSGTRTYLQLEGFWIDAKKGAELRIGRLDRTGGPSRAGAAFVVLVGALVATVFLLQPLRAARKVASDDVDELSPAARERESLYDAIRDLDDDFETGKVSAEDHRSLRDELRARAVASLRAERAEEAAERADTVPTSLARAPETCRTCGGKLDGEWSFCAHCGASVGPGPGPA